MASEQIFPNSEYIRKITPKGKAHNNNKMEQMNGEIREREKTVRGLKRRRTPIPLNANLKNAGVITQKQSINKAGLEDWELVSVAVFKAQGGTDLIAYLKREKR